MRIWNIYYRQPKDPSGRALCIKWGRNRKEAIEAAEHALKRKIEVLEVVDEVAPTWN